MAQTIAPWESNWTFEAARLVTIGFPFDIAWMSAGTRIDKWLWAVRLYKTRTVAADACKAGHVLVNGNPVKPSREVHVGETIQAKTGHITRTVRVIGLIEQRVSATIAREHAEDLTPPEEYNKPREPNYSRGIVRPKGLGRPTKKDRRQIEALEEAPPDLS